LSGIPEGSIRALYFVCAAAPYSASLCILCDLICTYGNDTDKEEDRKEDEREVSKERKIDSQVKSYL
jgi:hypothetical protein